MVWLEMGSKLLRDGGLVKRCGWVESAETFPAVLFAPVVNRAVSDGSREQMISSDLVLESKEAGSDGGRHSEGRAEVQYDTP